MHRSACSLACGLSTSLAHAPVSSLALGGFVLFLLASTGGASAQIFSAAEIVDDNVDGASFVLATVDIDKDGDSDLIVTAEEADTVAWYENLDGAGNFGTPRLIAGPSDALYPNGPQSADSKDIDWSNSGADKCFDVVVASEHDNTVWYYRQEVADAECLGTFVMEERISRHENGPVTVVLADADNDQWWDAIFATNGANHISWRHYRWNQATPTFGDTKVYVNDNAQGARGLIAADLTGDRGEDLVSASEHDDKIAWYRNYPNAFLNRDKYGIGEPTDPEIEYVGIEQVISTNADGAQAVFAADIDRDDDLDVISASKNDNKIAWYENTNGSGVFSSEKIISLEVTGARSVFAADFDLDCAVDVVAAAEGGDSIVWFKNEGGGTFGPPQVISSNAQGVRWVTGSDIDGDGDIDIIAASALDDTIAVYRNTIVAPTLGPLEIVELDTSVGTLRLGLAPDHAPETVARFLSYVEAGYYDEAIFHNAIAGEGFLFEVNTGTHRFNGASLERIDFPASENPIENEACLHNERGAIAATRTSEDGGFDGGFAIYVSDISSYGDIDSQYTVFGYLLDENNKPIGPEGSLGSAAPFVNHTLVDGHFALESEVRNDLRFLPLNVDPEPDETVDDYLNLSDLGSCFELKVDPTTHKPTLMALTDGTSDNPDEPHFVTYDDPANPDDGEMVVLAWTHVDLKPNPESEDTCVDLLSQVLPPEDITTPDSFTCPSPTENVSWLYQPVSACAIDDYEEWNEYDRDQAGGWLSCFSALLDGFGGVESIDELVTDCEHLATSEELLQIRRSEATDSAMALISRINTAIYVPEPDVSLLGLAALATVAYLKRRGSGTER